MEKNEPQVTFLKPSPEVVSVDFFTERGLTGDDYASLKNRIDKKMYDEIPVIVELIDQNTGELSLVVGCMRIGLDVKVVSAVITNDLLLDISYHSPQEIMEEFIAIIPDTPGQVVEYVDSYIYAIKQEKVS